GPRGAYWHATVTDLSISTEFSLAPSASTTITSSSPSGRHSRFRPTTLCQYFTPPDPSNVDWECVSDPDDKTIKLAAAGTSGIFAPTGTQLLNLSDNSVWDPRQFTLTTEDGSVYTIDQDGGVSQIEDRDANTLSITR